MSRPLRDTDPTKIHHISCRISKAELLLVPSLDINQILGGVLARYVEVHKIELYAYCFLSNHFHLLLSAPEARIPAFAADLNREITKRINRYLGREGNAWGRRYDDQIVIEERDSIEALLYVATNPVKHGLVPQPRHWPGVTCYHQLVGQKPKRYVFLEYSKYHRARQLAAVRGEIVHRRDFEKIYELKLKPLPVFSSLSTQQRVQELTSLLEDRTRELVNERRRQGLGFLGRKAVLAQRRLNNFPKEISKSNRPRCYTLSVEASRSYRKEEREKRSHYTESSIHFRLGKYEVKFPLFCILPPLHYIPATIGST